jgi:type IV pilus assembly protein PilF
MKPILALILVTTLLAACAAPPRQSSTTGTEGEAQKLARIRTELAAEYYKLQRYQVALDELAMAIEADSRYAPAYGMRGLVYMALHEADKAQASFREALDIRPDDPELRNNYGWFLCQSQRYEESLKQFRIAARNPLYPTPEKALFNAGLCAAKQGDDAGAEEFFKEALNRQARFAPAYLELAELTNRRGQPDRAKGYLAAYTELGAPTARSLWLGVRLSRAMGERESEASYSLQLRKRFPDAPEARWLLTGQYDQVTRP